MKKSMIGVAAVLFAALCLANDVAEIKAKVEKDHTVIAVDQFHGFDRVVFDFDGYEAWVVCPVGGTREGRPWTWTMQWATAFVPRTNVPQMLRDGYHHVTINTFKHRMDETGLKVSAAFQKYLVEKLGFAPKAYLIGMSWGGFFSIRYANRYPQDVAKIYMDAPLLCFKDGRLGIGPWEGQEPAGGWVTSPEMPRNMAESIAKADIPLLVLYGGMDTTCPPDYNCEPFMERFRAAGGDLTVKKRGLYAHHPHGVEESDDSIKEFFERPKTLPVADYPDGAAFTSKDGRIESPKFDLDKTADENAWYLLTFRTKGEASGCWRVDTEDSKGGRLPDAGGPFPASSDWMTCSAVVPVRPDAVSASISFIAKDAPAVCSVRMKRISVADAVEAERRAYAAGPKIKGEATAKDWKRLPNARVAIKVAKDYRIVLLGDATLKAAWRGNANALLAQEYSDTAFRTYLVSASQVDSVSAYKPNLVVVGAGEGLASEDDVVRTIRRCQALGAEVVVGASQEDGAFFRSAAERADVQFWDLTTDPDGGDAQKGMWLYLYFNAAQK